MSGGHFEYSQYRINDIADEIEEIIEKNGKPIPWEDLDYYDRQQFGNNEKAYEKAEAVEKFYNTYYPPEIIERFKEGLKVLRRAYIYAQRIDWLLSGDDGEDSFMRRLDKELVELNGKEADNGKS